MTKADSEPNQNRDTVLDMGPNNRVTIRLANVQILALLGMAASVVFSVWITTRDLSNQVEELSGNVENLGRLLDDHEKRLRDAEVQSRVTSEIQKRVLEVLHETQPDVSEKMLKRK